MNALALQAPVAPAVDLTKKFSEMTDAELVVLCQNKNDRAFDVLMQRHHRLVTGMISKLAPDWNDAADLTQECFIRMWRGIDKLQNPKAFKSWLCQIVTHLFYDELRKAHRRLPAMSLDQPYGDDEEGPTRDIPDAKPTPEEVLERKDTNKIVSAAIDTLPEQFRTAMMLRDLDDMTYEEIAHRTQADTGTVKSRISRARAKVQKVLTPQFGKHRKLSA